MSMPTIFSYLPKPPSPSPSPSPVSEATTIPQRPETKDDEPSDGPPSPIDINTWGPATWHFLHVYSFEYPTRPNAEHRQRALALLQTVHANLPCNTCREHFGKILSEHEPRLESGDAFSRWMVDAHNMVNRRLGKPGMQYSDVFAKYHRAGGTLCDDVVFKSRRSAMLTVAVVAVLAILLTAIVFYNIGRARGGRHTRSK